MFSLCALRLFAAKLAAFSPLVLAVALSVSSIASPVAAQTARSSPTTTPPAARPADVASIDAILGALYDVISGPAGEARDWNRFRSLFAQGARLIPTSQQPDGSRVMSVWTPNEYVERAGPGLERNGFFEREIGRTTEQFGQVAHVFSAYDSKRTLQDAAPFARGINSIQLRNDGTRWFVVTIFWDSERPGQPIPAKYLGTP